MLQHLKSQKYTEYFNKMEHGRFKLSINLTEILGLADELYQIVENFAKVEADQIKDTPKTQKSGLAMIEETSDL